MFLGKLSFYYTNNVVQCRLIKDLGDKWHSATSYQTYVADTNERFPNHICFEVMNPLDPTLDKCIYPTFLILLSDDKSVGHAISMCDSWLFDSNLQHGMEVTTEHLDWCCSSQQSKQKFVKVYWSMRLLPRPDPITTMKRDIEPQSVFGPLFHLFSMLKLPHVCHTLEENAEECSSLGINVFYKLPILSKMVCVRKVKNTGILDLRCNDQVHLLNMKFRNGDGGIWGLLFNNWFCLGTENNLRFLDKGERNQLHTKFKMLIYVLLACSKNKDTYIKAMADVMQDQPMLNYQINYTSD